MAKKIDMNFVIGNGLFYLEKEKVTRREIYKYINIVDRLLPDGYYTSGINDYYDNFCDSYPMLVRKIDFGNELMIICDRYELERYFKIGFDSKILKVFEESSYITKKQEEESLSFHNKQKIKK